MSWKNIRVTVCSFVCAAAVNAYLLPSAEAQCNGDIVAPFNGTVGFSDLSRVIDCVRGIMPVPECDINGDGSIDECDVDAEVCLFSTFNMNPACCAPACGGCCGPDEVAGECNVRLEDACVDEGLIFLGAGVLCGACTAGTNAGGNCRVCAGGPNVGDPCLGDPQCPSSTCVRDDTECPDGAGGFETCLQVVDCPFCHGDIFAPFNGAVEFPDVAFLIDCMRCVGATCPGGVPLPECDINGDGSVDECDVDAAVCLFATSNLNDACCTPACGACCGPDVTGGECNARLEPDCLDDGLDFLGAGVLCGTCSAGTNAGGDCRVCAGGANAGMPCRGDAQCPSSTCERDNSECPDGMGGFEACLRPFECPLCHGDIFPPFNNNVEFTDVALVVDCVRCTPGACPGGVPLPECDINADGSVDECDVDAAVCLFATFNMNGACCTPACGACCGPGAGAAECNARLEDACVDEGLAFLGAGVLCGLCSAGPNASDNCRTCAGGPNAGRPCLGDAQCPSSTCAIDDGQCPDGAGGFETCLPQSDCPPCDGDVTAPFGEPDISFPDLSFFVDCYRGLVVDPRCDLNFDGCVNAGDVNSAICLFRTSNFNGACCAPATAPPTPLVDTIGTCVEAAGPGGLCTVGAPCPSGAVCAPLLKNRVISFRPTGDSLRPLSALRVTMTSLQVPNPPNAPSYPPPDFSAFESGVGCSEGAAGCVRWVGPPRLYIESSGNPTNFAGAYLQCTPYFADWTNVGQLHVSGADIVPSSLYAVEAVAPDCAGAGPVSAALNIPTARWGDLASRFNPPSVTTQPDSTDTGEIVNKFEGGLPPYKVQMMLHLNVPAFAPDINFLDISDLVSAFGGRAYPYSGPCTCPSMVACTTAVTCDSVSDCAVGEQCSTIGICTTAVDPCGRCDP